jgi:hypothetical protein
MENILKLSGISLLAVLVITSCKKEKTQEEDNDNELITTVELKVTESGTNNSSIFKWEDIDGPGGEDPVIDNITLQPNKVYSIQVAFIDASQNPPESLTSEVLEESDVHRLYYQPAASTGITVNGLDTDDNGLPLGLNCSWKTTGAGSGNMIITLRHYAEGGKEESDPVSSSKSTTDAEVEFPVIISAQ